MSRGVGCHSNRGIARVVARTRKKLRRRSVNFTPYVGRKEAAVPSKSVGMSKKLIACVTLCLQIEYEAQKALSFVSFRQSVSVLCKPRLTSYKDS